MRLHVAVIARKIVEECYLRASPTSQNCSRIRWTVANDTWGCWRGPPQRFVAARMVLRCEQGSYDCEPLGVRAIPRL